MCSRDVRGYVGCAVIALQGELDISNTAEFSSRLAAVASRGPWAIVDLAELAYIDCSALGVLAAARERARLAGGDVLLARPRGAVARLLVLTGHAELFSVFPSVGCAAFSAGLTAFGRRLAMSSMRESPAEAARKTWAASRVRGSRPEPVGTVEPGPLSPAGP